MNRLSFWCVAMLVWITTLYSMERLLQPLAFTPFLFEFVMAAAVLTIVVPWCHRVSWLWTFGAAAAALLIVNSRLGFEMVAGALPLVVTEIVSLGVTVALAWRIARRARALQRDVGDAVFGHLDDRSQPFEVAQVEIYREVRRARLYQRPLALMTISSGDETPKVLPSRLMEMIEKELTQKYLAARLADLLTKELRYSDIIAQRDGYFVALLPESSREEVLELATRIEAAAQETLGLKVRFGVASFPNQEVTFEKLLERAETEMRGSTAVKRPREIVAAAR